MFYSDSIAVWALVHDQTREIVENPRFRLFLKKSIFDDFRRLVRPETMDVYNFWSRNRV